jgi:hypothetical protein
VARRRAAAAAFKVVQIKEGMHCAVFIDIEFLCLKLGPTHTPQASQIVSLPYTLSVFSKPITFA